MNGCLQVSRDQWIIWWVVMGKHKSHVCRKPPDLTLLQDLQIISPSLDKYTCKCTIKKCNKLYIYPMMGGCQNRILIFFKTTKMIYSVRLKSKQPFYIWKKACHCASRLGTQTSSKFTNYSLNQGMQETSQRWADKNSLMLLAPHRFTFASLKSSPNQGMAHFLERCSIRTLCGSKRKNSIAVWSVCGSLSAEHNNLL